MDLNIRCLFDIVLLHVSEYFQSTEGKEDNSVLLIAGVVKMFLYINHY